ncbi:metallophosphoesterase [Actinokineospora auranticolor]|uniref:Calcineurin-like phosphoesterase family protein n=1 Tax=Actinokineospora auranticolor TaxID=155976 RepID=A0A2S6GK64_9PSEU|nr:metallophosphoesterase [Actinokineospora auranticolor]PPK65618.1 calcineurin-like phosphoesterase family protein [Actinokineospora auranticolor]
MNEPDPDGMTRRQLLRHTAWFGAAVVLTVAAGEVISHIHTPDAPVPDDPNALRFVQVSDSHIGFTGAANTAVTDSFHRAVDQVNALPYRPDFVIHTGDLTHLSTPAQFDQVRQMMGGIRAGGLFTVPGEHDSVDDAGQKYRAAFGKGSTGDGWYSFDLKGAHFIALVNTLNLEKLGHLGVDQVEFVRKDVAGLSSDTPIVVFSHIPLFAMYPQWGWGTDDAGQVLNLLRRFASVTCLNGHVHQLFTKTEGNVTFHSATTTAYPLPKPGTAPAPAPVTLPAGQLADALGIREVTYRQGPQPLAVKDVRLA